MCAHPAEAAPRPRRRLADSLELVLPAFPPALGGPDVVTSLREMACALAPVHRAGFECRLDADDPRVDLQQGIFPGDGEPDTLLRYIAAAARAPGRPLSAAWDAVARLAERWRDPGCPLHDGMTELWLEFDAGARDGAGALEPSDLIPSVFALLQPPDRRPAVSAALADEVLALLLDAADAARLRPLVARCSEACVEGARVTHVGVMLGRGGAGCRVHVSPLPVRALPAFLAQVEWPGDGRDVQRLAASLLDYVDTVVLCLDIGTAVLPQLGLECFFNQKHGLDPRWEPFLEHLVRTGVCTAMKAEALLAWPDIVGPGTVPHPWPDDLLIASLLAPPQRLGVIDRRLSHVKLAYSPSQPLRAKGYFGYGHVWTERGPDRRAPVAADRAPDGRDVEIDVRPERCAPAVVASAVAPSAETLPAEPVIGAAIEWAITFLLGARNQGGWWRDFYDLGRDGALDRRVGGYASDEWVTAYVGAALADAGGDRARAAAGEGWELLAGRRASPEGWGYHAQLPPDADSTVWALRLARALGVAPSERTRAAERFLAAQTRADGAVSCYRPADCPRIARFLRLDGPYDGWCGPHTCVTAAAGVLAPDRTRPYLRRVQREDGRWMGHWWDDDAYTTARATEALAGDACAESRAAIARAAAWASAQVDAGGAVYSPSHGGASVFATALCATTLAIASSGFGDCDGDCNDCNYRGGDCNNRNNCDYRGDRGDRDDRGDRGDCGGESWAALGRAAAWLVAQQRSDGSFPASARLRVPAPAATDPLASPDGTLTYLDRNALFTTATAITALDAVRRRLVGGRSAGTRPAR